MRLYDTESTNRYKPLVVAPQGKAVEMTSAPKAVSIKDKKGIRLVNTNPCQVITEKLMHSCPLSGSYRCPECGLICCGRHALYKDRLKGEKPRPYCPRCADGNGVCRS